MDATTHLVECGTTRVTKKFRSWGRAEPEREWRTLRLLATYAPGLAPQPLCADVSADPPTVVMSRLPGVPLPSTGTPIAGVRLDAMAGAIDRLHRAVPASVLASLPVRATSPLDLAEKTRVDLANRRARLSDPFVRRAIALGETWLDSTAVHASEPPAVFGQGDGNPTNYLWDGSRVRLLDFEDSGRSDRAYELAEIVEHLASGVGGVLDTDAFLARFELDEGERVRLRELRRLCAYSWLVMLLPGGPAESRNPPDTSRRQAERVLALLGG